MDEFLIRLTSIFKKYFITGLLLVLPLWITIYILWIVISVVGASVTPIFRTIFAGTLPVFAIKLLSFLVTVLLVWTFGLVTANILGKKLLQELEKVIKRLPLVKDVYNSAKQFIKLITIKNVDFKHVVLLEFPRTGIYSIGFVTNNKPVGVNGIPFISVFVPTTPNPTTGFYMLVPSSQVKYVDLKIDEAVKMIMSGGVLAGDVNLTEFKHIPQENAPESR